MVLKAIQNMAYSPSGVHMYCTVYKGNNTAGSIFYQDIVDENQSVQLYKYDNI